MQALRGVLHEWADLEENWTSVPPITRPVPNRWATQRDLLGQPPGQIESNDKLFIFSNYIHLAAVHVLGARKPFSHYVNLVDTGIPVG